MRTMPNIRAGEYHVGNTGVDVPSRDISTDRPCYLLFAGASLCPPRGGLGDLVGTFACEEAARKAFHDLRVQGTSNGAWAQLASINLHSGVRPVCWFGTRDAGRVQHVRGASTKRRGSSGPSPARKWRSRLERTLVREQRVRIS